MQRLRRSSIEPIIVVISQPAASLAPIACVYSAARCAGQILCSLVSDAAAAALRCAELHFAAALRCLRESTCALGRHSCNFSKALFQPFAFTFLSYHRHSSYYSLSILCRPISSWAPRVITTTSSYAISIALLQQSDSPSCMLGRTPPLQLSAAA